MLVISLAVIFCRLAFSAQYDLRHVQEKCEGVCDRRDYCGMPSEIAVIYMNKIANTGRHHHHHYEEGDHHHHHYEEEENEAGDKLNRRLLDTSTTDCQTSDAAFDKKCQEMPTCGSNAPLCHALQTCAQVAAAGLCTNSPYSEICCRSCALESLAGCQNSNLLTGRPTCSNEDMEAIAHTARICNDYPAPNNQANAATRCAKYCWDFLGRPEWCLKKAVCIDDQAALDNYCKLPAQALCGYQSVKVPTCEAAEKLGWCHGKHGKWMKEVCPVACQTCPTCETYTCPDTYVKKVSASARASTTLTTDSCCVSKTKLCSCSWECMFSDNCCADFGDECCNKY